MTPLESLAAETLKQPLPDEIRALAQHVRVRHEPALAVLAYGSCLRGVSTSDSLIDLYVLTETEAAVSANAFSRLGCRMVPPNVYYAELSSGDRLYRAKYAVLPLSLFAAWMRADNPYFWARFAQPSALAWSLDEASAVRVTEAIAAAIRTMYGEAQALLPDGSARQQWAKGFEATYGTELRSEAAGSRAGQLVESNAAYYDAAAALLASAPGASPANWPLRRFKGKLWSVARLSKAAFTFSGGVDYIAWKIERHSGHKIDVKDWHRRHPIIAGFVLLPQLLKRGAVR